MEKKIPAQLGSHLNGPVNPNAFHRDDEDEPAGGEPHLEEKGQRNRPLQTKTGTEYGGEGSGDWGGSWKFTIKWNTGCFRQTLGTARKTTPYK